MKTGTNTSKTFGNLIDNRNNKTNIEFRAGVYEIPGLHCNKRYVGETNRQHLHTKGWSFETSGQAASYQAIMTSTRD